MTALRETFEESGILLVAPPTPTHAHTHDHDHAHDATYPHYPTTAQLAAARRAIHARTDPLTFPDFLARHHLAPPVDRLVPFSQWVTPAAAPVRFHTRFYVLFVDELHVDAGDGGALLLLPRLPPSSTDGDVLVQNPTADGGVEVIAASWIRPGDVFAAFRRGELSLFPPQYYLLTTLGGLLDSMPPGNNRTELLRTCIGGFGSRLFNPRPSGFTEEDGKGQRSILTYEGDELRGGKAGDRHRCLVRFQGRVSRENPNSEAVAPY